jgi:hypothetical protein
MVGYLTWDPDIPYENFDYVSFSAGFNSMVYTHVFAFAGILIAGGYSDSVSRKNTGKKTVNAEHRAFVCFSFIVLIGKSSILFHYIYWFCRIWIHGRAFF